MFGCLLLFFSLPVWERNLPRRFVCDASCLVFFSFSFATAVSTLYPSRTVFHFLWIRITLDRCLDNVDTKNVIGYASSKEGPVSESSGKG